MTQRKKISELDRKKLYALSGNQCYYPDCKERVYNLEEEASVGEICHIHAVNPGGPRFDAKLSEEEINSFENILLLCPTHHSYIDKNKEKYPPAFLIKLKREHEEKFYHNSGKFEELFEEREGKIDALQLNELKAIDSTNNISTVEFILPAKKQYPPVKDYITRYLTGLKDNFDHTLVSRTLVEIIKEENHITVLGVAGSGKSIELLNASYVFSQPESEFYPIKSRLNTLTLQSIEDFLILEDPNIRLIPHERLLILLDGLDEVHSDYIDIVANNIYLFAKKYDKAKIVVSSRNNLYITETDKGNAKIEGFVTFIIKPLEYSSVYKYLESKVGINPSLFIDDLRKKKYYDLLYSPFYLVNLVEYYNAKKVIPESKKTVFDYLIEQRIESDFNKFKNSGVKIQNYELKIQKCIEKLAIAAECLGRNYLDDQSEVRKIIPDDKLFEIIERTFLFNKSIESSKKWEFEHNNFQEFLAARFLSLLSVDEIKKYVSFQPKLNKIKPSWLNTVSFLFSILEFESDKFSELIDWIQKIEPDILVRFEKDKINITVREKLFKKIYEEYETKRIVIRNEKFESEDLALFVSDSTEIIGYLISKIESSNDKIIISEALELLPYFDNIILFHDSIKNVIANKLKQDILSDEIKYYCLTTLSRLKIYDEIFTKEMLGYFNLDSSPYLRAGIYSYLENSNNVDDYIPLVLNGIELNEKSGMNENRIYNEKYSLEKLINKIESPESIKKILDWSIIHDANSLGDNVFFEMVQTILLKSINAYSSGFEYIFESVFNLLLVFSTKYYHEQRKTFKDFFKETKTEIRAFKKLCDDRSKPNADGYSYEKAIGLVCNKDCVNFLVEEVKAGRLHESEALKFRNLLNWSGEKEIHDFFYEELEKIDREAFAYKKIIDYNEINKARRRKDIQLLLNQEEFIKEIKETFLEEGGEKLTLTFDQLCDFKKKRFSDEEMTNNVVVDFLRDRSRSKGLVEFVEIEKLLRKEDNWNWFTLHKLVNYDTQYEDFEVTDKVLSFIEKWVYKEIGDANFKSAITVDEQGYHYWYKELYLAYFTQRFDLKIKRELLLDFLFVDCYLLPGKRNDKTKLNESELSFTQRYLIEKLGENLVTKKIVENLRSKELVPEVKKTHYSYCLIQRVVIISDIILEDILSPDHQEHERISLIDKYIELSRNYKELFELLDKLSIESKIHSIKLLFEYKYNPIIDYSYKEIANQENEEIKLKIIQLLIKGNITGSISLLKEWIKRNRKLPDHIRIDFKKSCKDDLNDFIDIFEDSLQNKYGESSWTSRNEFLSPIIELGSQDDENYTIVYYKLNYWIEKYENMNYLYYHLQKLEQLFYSKKIQAVNFQDVLILIEGKSQESTYKKSKIKSFWEANKTIIDIILAVIAVIGLVLTVFALL